MDKKYPISFRLQMQKTILGFFRILLLLSCLLILFGQNLNNGSIYIQSNKSIVLILLLFIIFSFIIDNLFSTIIVKTEKIVIYFDFWKIEIPWDQIQSIHLCKMIPWNDVYVITLNRRMPYVYYFYSLFFLGVVSPSFIIHFKHEGCNEIIKELTEKTHLTIINDDD